MIDSDDGILAKNEINHLKALFPNCRSPLSEKILKEISEKSEISQEQNCCCYISLHNAEKDFVIIIKTVTVTRSMQGACDARQHCSQHALCGTGSMVQNVKRRVQPSWSAESSFVSSVGPLRLNLLESFFQFVAMSIFHVAIGLTGLMILPMLPDLAANLLISLSPGVKFNLIWSFLQFLFHNSRFRQTLLYPQLSPQ
jgi:hypothetical protein